MLSEMKRQPKKYVLQRNSYGTDILENGETGRTRIGYIRRLGTFDTLRYQGELPDELLIFLKEINVTTIRYADGHIKRI